MDLLHAVLLVVAALTWLPAGDKISTFWNAHIKSSLTLPALAGWLLVLEVASRALLSILRVGAAIVAESYARLRKAAIALIRPSGSRPKRKSQTEADAS